MSWLKAVIASAIVALACHSTTLSAATPEAQVKAAYLLKLASFVRWPAGAGGDTFRICVSGRADIADVLAELAGNQRVGGKSIALVRLDARGEQQVRSCDILFLGRGGDSARSLFAAARGAPVLTVTDRNNGTRGGAVEFVLQDGKVRFFIQRGEAESRQLEFSSKLLDVAAGVSP